MAKIYMVRHGQAGASWSEDPDPDLSKEGFGQAIEAAQTLWKLGTLDVLSSPLKRCRSTAAPYESLSGGAKVTIDKIVSEVPSPAGMSVEDRGPWLHDVFTQNWADQNELLTNWRGDLIAKLTSLQNDTIVFSHYVAINVAVGHAAGDDRIHAFRPDNASITILETDGSKLTLIEKGRENTTVVN